MENSSRHSLKVGVIGGGQLAQMLTEAGKKLGVDVFIQAASLDDPAARLVGPNSLVLADTKDISGTRQLSQKSKHITFENEWIDIESLSLLEDSGVTFIPSLTSMEPLVNKLSQRKLLAKLNIPGPEWISLSLFKIDNLVLKQGWNFPLMAKSSLGGYDGKGTKVLRDYNDLRNLLLTVDSKQWFLEKWINYKKELAIIISRDTYGKVRLFPVSETYQTNQICNWVLSPAEISHQVQAMAENIAISLVRELNYIGVLAIEFFYGDDGLLVNEIAPRTHNSGHLTIEACNSSQFDHQIAITSCIPLSDPELIAPGAMMVNLLGYAEDTDSSKTRLNLLSQIDGLNIHWYNKTKNLHGRKMGHVTKLLSSDNSRDREEEALDSLKKIRSIWPLQ